MNLKLNSRLEGMGSGRLQSRSRENRQNPGQMEAQEILVAPTRDF